MVDQMAGQEPPPPSFRRNNAGTGMWRASAEMDVLSSGMERPRGRLGRDGKDIAEAVEASRMGVERRMAIVYKDSWKVNESVGALLYTKASR